MAFSYLGSKPLSYEQHEVVNSIISASAFGDFCSDSILLREADKRHKQEEEERMQPYADHLFNYLKSLLPRNRESYFSELKETGQCIFYDYLSVSYNQTLLAKKAALQEMTPEERAELEDIPRHIFDSTLGVKHWFNWETLGARRQWIQGPLLPSVKVHRIFRACPDLLVRIAMLFGPKFKATLKHDIVEQGGEGQWGWSHKNIKVVISYEGDNISPKHVEKMLEVFQKDQERQPATLSETQWLCGACFPERPKPMPVALLG